MVLNLFIYFFKFFFRVNTRTFFRWKRINSMKIDYWRIKSMIVDAHSIKGKKHLICKIQTGYHGQKACPMFLTAT